MGPKIITFEVSKFKFLKTIPLLSLCKLQKTQISENGDVMRITSSVYRKVWKRSVFIQSDIAIWPGMHNIAYSVFLLICVK